MTYVVSYLLIPELGDGTMWWKLSTVITCGTLAGAIIPELVKVFTSTESAHVREVVSSSREGGASLNILAGLVAGNFSAYWLGLSIVGADEHRLLGQPDGVRRADDCGAGVCVRSRGVRLPRNGPGDDRRRFLRSRSPTTRSRSSSCRSSKSCRASRTRSSATTGLRPTSPRRSTCSRRTTAPATRSRRPRSPCSSARR